MMKLLRVLILEDNDADLDLIVLNLRKAGYEPDWRQATTKAEFSACLTSDLDLILADYQLPGYSGLGALRLLKERRLNIPFILISGAIGEELAVTMMKEGAADYLLKDRLARLGPAINHALRERHLRQQNQDIENALHQSTQNYRLLVENSPDGIGVLEEGRLVYVNPAGVRIIGAPNAAAVTSKWVTDLAHPAHREGIKEQLALLEHSEGTSLIEGKIVRLDDKVIDLEIWATPFIYQQRPALQVLFRDVTERKLAEAELHHAYQTARESEARFRATFEQAAVGINHQTPNGQFLRVNQKFCDILGYTRQELLRLTNRLISHPDDMEESQLQRHRLLTGELQTYQLVKRYVHKNGQSIWVNITVSLAHGPAGEPLYLISVVEDITEHRLLEEQFRQAQKMEAIGQLAGGVAHDFNNLLTVIIACSSLALRESDLQKVQAALGEILVSAERAAALTRHLLAFSRQQVLQPRLVDLNSVVANLEVLLQRLIGEDISFVTNMAPELWPVKADPGQLEQVLTNLAINARDAMPSGGRLLIETTNTDLGSGQTELPAKLAPGSYVRITVSDSGHGMDMQTRARIFEPFFTTKAAGKGTGLGLSTVHGIITQSGGHIRVLSEVHLGTTFEIFLPRAELSESYLLSPADSTPIGDQAETIGLQPGDYTILVVEDEEAIRKLIGQFLTKTGYTLLLASNGDEALQLSQEQTKTIHLLLTDLTLPGSLNGHRLAQQLTQQRPQLKVLYTSGYPDKSLISHEILNPNSDFIQKPFTPLDLLQKLHKLLAIC